MEEGNNDDKVDCYLYVQIIASKTGEAAQREIVPSSCVTTFDYSAYMENNNLYKNKRLSIRLHPDGKKKKCYVLYAAINEHEVRDASKRKRFAPPPPTLAETLTDDSTSTKTVERENTEQSTDEDIDSEQELQKGDDAAQLEADKNKKEMLKRAKTSRKRKAETARNNKENNEERILQRYLEDVDNEENEFNMGGPLASSSLKNVSENNHSDKVAIRQQEIRIKHLEHQLKQCRKEITNEQSPNENRNTVSAPHNTACCTAATDYFKIHDKMFNFVKEQVEVLEYDEEGNVHLGSEVYCNPIAYNDAFKSKKAFNCLSLLSEGVYGLEELSQRCVRKQANTRHKKVLSPTKRLVIEKKVYAFMRMKDQSLSQIDDFLDKMNAHHRQVINSAKARLDYMKKQKEKEKEIDQTLQTL